jgi:hypothetical protein
MEDSVQFVILSSYNGYSDKPEFTEPIFHVFLRHTDRTYYMPSMHNKTRVSLMTLYSWREQVRAQAEWQRSHKLFAMKNRILPEEAEEIIAQSIRANFVALGRDLDRPTLNSTPLSIQITMTGLILYGKTISESIETNPFPCLTRVTEQ